MAKKTAFLFAFILMAGQSIANDISLGMYYFGGWSSTFGLGAPTPWRRIQEYPEREPLLGWYDDSRLETVGRQLEWMADYNIGFVVFSWYWSNRMPKPETAVRSYLNAPARARIPYALLWANHDKAPTSIEEWDEMVEYWLARHLSNPEYLKIDGKPAVFIFSADGFRDQAKVMGIEPAKMLERARDAAKAKGLNGLYFVLCVAATDYWIEKFVPSAGLDAITGYNYHFGRAGPHNTQTPPSHSFAELDRGYRMQWAWILSKSKIPYFIPMTSGWDMRPWGGSKDPLHDNSMSVPDEFEIHLRTGYDAITRNPVKTKSIGMLCCWNEYGEGSIIEPSKRYGFEYLRRIHNVFSREKNDIVHFK
ncbi:MAG: glycoside hydrolase family 99-like domain-containing protein [Azoarcus sp.]|jgi:hypothetical protein|nr:glycoside hydrolase family 99-like domain-containing protein [Azoarcus sp.]